MNRTLVRSGNVRSVGYDPAFQTREVGSHIGGDYKYSDVSEAIYQSFMRAASSLYGGKRS